MSVKKLAWLIMTLLALGSAVYALMNVSLPDFRPAFVVNIFQESPFAGLVHLLFGLIAMALGPFQFVSSIRLKKPKMHRLCGQLYVACVGLSAIAGFILAWRSFGGLVTHVGFALMATTWFYTTLMAFIKAKQGDFASHKSWMIRSYAITLSGVTLRIYLGLGVAFGIPFSELYPVLSWLAWVPNILIVEWFVLNRQSSRKTLPN